MTTLNLHAEALADLRRSGLSDATIIEAGLYTPAPGELPRLLAPRLVNRVTHILVIPYRAADPFYRAKLFPSVPDRMGHTIRYYQPAGTAPRLYLPAPVGAVLADPRTALYVTEGEKKALKASQEGLPCIGLGGLWNWRHEGRPIGDLDRIDWYGRATIIVPDSDVWTRGDLLQPVYALGKELETRGAAVVVLKLPAGPQGSKVGLDDYLCSNTIVDLDARPRLALKHSLFSRTATWWREGVRRREEDPTGGEPTVLELLQRPGAGRVLHPRRTCWTASCGTGWRPTGPRRRRRR